MTRPENAGAGDGRRLYWAAMVAILLGLTALFHAVTRNDGGMSLQQSADGRAMIVLQRKHNGHFLADGTINGHAVRFLVDTGATDIAISERLARSIGVEFGPPINLMTAAGPSRGWITRLDTVEVGVLALQNVRASISPGLGEDALLGMSFLRHFSLVQEGDTLVLATPLGIDS